MKDTANKIIELVGGIENISSMEHCITRLRLQLKDSKQFQEDKIKELEKVKGVIVSGGQYQIILGTGVVNKVFKEAYKILCYEQKHPSFSNND